MELQLCPDEGTESLMGQIILPPGVLPEAMQLAGLCPQCGAKPEKRVQNSSFGTARWEICSNCGHEFKEPPNAQT